MTDDIIEMRLVRLGDPFCSRRASGCRCCIYVPANERMTITRLHELTELLSQPAHSNGANADVPVITAAAVALAASERRRQSHSVAVVLGRGPHFCPVEL